MLKTILIVDDEFDIAELLCCALEAEGYRCVQAGDGEEGLALIRQESPNLVILDIMMPRLDGREVLRRLRSVPAISAVPVVLMSAADTIPEGAALGHAAFLRKPFSIDAALDLAARLLGAPPSP